MHYSTIAVILASITSSVSAIPNQFLQARQSSGGFSGVATFNDYVDQVNNRNQPTVCGDFNDDEANGIYAAAAGDLSPNISPGSCDYDDLEWRKDPSNWYARTLPSCYLTQLPLPCPYAALDFHSQIRDLQ